MTRLRTSLFLLTGYIRTMRRMLQLPRTAAMGLLLCLGVFCVGCGQSPVSISSATAATPANLPPIWVGAWGESMTNAQATSDNNGGTDRSFRFFVISTIDGTQERVKFSNHYGTTDITLGAARLSVAQKDGSPGIIAGQDVPLLFSGAKSVTIPAGGSVTSDPANLSFGMGQLLAISTYLQGSFGTVSRRIRDRPSGAQ
jgi:hypothetical protein